MSHVQHQLHSHTSLVPRPSHRPVFDHLQYAKLDGGKAWEQGYSYTSCLSISAHPHTSPLCTHTPLLSAHPHMYIQDSSWPVLCHGVAMLFAMLSVSRGVSTIEPVNKVVVPILLFIIVFCFYWALFLPYSADGIIHMFSPTWSECTT